MWRKGTLVIKKQLLTYCAKVYDEGSEYGINEGRISKLEVRQDNKLLLNYDRGWDIEPDCELAEIALAMLLDLYK